MPLPMSVPLQIRDAADGSATLAVDVDGIGLIVSVASASGASSGLFVSNADAARLGLALLTYAVGEGVALTVVPNR